MFGEYGEERVSRNQIHVVLEIEAKPMICINRSSIPHRDIIVDEMKYNYVIQCLNDDSLIEISDIMLNLSAIDN